MSGLLSLCRRVTERRLMEAEREGKRLMEAEREKRLMEARRTRRAGRRPSRSQGSR